MDEYNRELTLCEEAGDRCDATQAEFDKCPWWRVIKKISLMNRFRAQSIINKRHLDNACRLRDLYLEVKGGW